MLELGMIRHWLEIRRARPRSDNLVPNLQPTLGRRRTGRDSFDHHRLTVLVLAPPTYPHLARVDVLPSLHLRQTLEHIG